MVARQGDVFWVDLGRTSGSGPGYRHPHVVIQNNVFNKSDILTIVVCAITSNMRLAGSPGNVALKKGTANLPKRCVVNVSQIFTVDKDDLAQKVGALSPRLMREVLDGIRLVTEPREIDTPRLRSGILD